MNDDSIDRISIVSFNVRGLRDRVKRRSIFRHLRINYKQSVIFLQETHSKPKDENSWQCEWAGKILFSHDTGHSQSGVAALISPDLKYPVEKITHCDSGRIVGLHILAVPDPFVLIGVYAPASDDQKVKCQFLDSIREILLCFSNHKTFLSWGFQHQNE